MSSKKDNAITRILEDFETYSRTTLSQLAMLEKVFSMRTPEKIDEVTEKIKEVEARIDKFEVKISERIINTIVLYQPVAGELRKLMAIYRMIISLERISDYVLNITRVFRQIEKPAVIEKNSEMVENMLTMTSNMLSRALFSFKNEDTEYAKWAIKSVDSVHEMRRTGVKKTIAQENLDQETLLLFNSYLDIKNIMSNLERIADHTTNIAEASIFALEGRDIRHQKLDDDEFDVEPKQI